MANTLNSTQWIALRLRATLSDNIDCHDQFGRTPDDAVPPRPAHGMMAAGFGLDLVFELLPGKKRSLEFGRGDLTWPFERADLRELAWKGAGHDEEEEPQADRDAAVVD